MVWKPYKSYNFKDKDPVIDHLRTLVQDSGASYQELRDQSGVSTSCMYGWFNGKTRRPTHAAVAAVAAVLGYRTMLVKMPQARVYKFERKKKRA